MATIQVFKRNYNMAPLPGNRKQSDFALYIVQTDGKNAFGAPIAPRAVTYSNWGRSWVEVARDGRLPYLVNDATKLPKMSFTMVLANSRTVDWNATGGLMVLKRLAETNVPLQIRYGGYFESTFRWRCTNFSFSSVQRRPSDNAITHAEVEMEFTILQDVNLKTGPIKGGTGGSSTIKKPPASKSLGKRKYKFKKGDTFHKLSIRFYKSDRYWRYLMDINKIKDTKKVKVGQIIKY